MKIKVPLFKPYFESEEIEEIKKVLDSGWVSQGPETRLFEEDVRERTGTKYAIAVNNCTAALHLALLAIGIKKGDEVLVADYTYPATGHSVLYCGAKPVFVDIDSRTYNVDPVQLKKKITKRTKAIIPVHTFGQPVEMDSVLEIAEKHNLKVVEDAACAFGARYRKKYTGTMGDIGCFSFHARKGVTTGEGGMLVTDDESMARTARTLSVFGITSAWDREIKGFTVPEFTMIGYNYKMSDITAAVGVVQLKRLDSIIKKKRALAKYWGAKLEGIPDVEPPYEEKGSLHIYQSYVSLVRKGLDRNKLIERLAKLGVQAQIGTYASHVQPVYKSKDKCPVSKEIFNRALALPLYYDMTETQIDAAAKALRSAIK